MKINILNIGLTELKDLDNINSNFYFKFYYLINYSSIINTLYNFNFFLSK